MEDFWPAAARMVKVGGTVALWTQSSFFCRKLILGPCEIYQRCDLEASSTPSSLLARNQDLLASWQMFAKGCQKVLAIDPSLGIML
jgi:hypothetical protein